MLETALSCKGAGEALPRGERWPAVSRTGSQIDAVFAAVEKLADRLADRGAEIERAGRLPADVVQELHSSGVFRLWVPVELGGFEASPADVLRLLQILAAADGSTGWCAATGLASNIVGALLPEDAAKQVFVTGSELCGGALMPGGRAVPQSDGSFLVDGRWRFGSGSQHCDWLVGGALVIQDGPPGIRAVLMPASAMRFHDTWEVLGLNGTGSVDYEVSGLRVPAEHAIELATTVPWPAGSMWRIPLRSLLYPVLAAVPLGIARRALSELLDLAGGRTRFGSSRPLAEREVVQADLARATAMLDSSAAYLTNSLQALADTAATGQVPSAIERATARLAAVHATDQAARVVALCYRTAGTAAIYQAGVLERTLRDVNMTTQHYALSAPGYEIAGRVLLGFEPDPLL
jgi:alkylation response protein AidB-like acyl-CoA dehydrogenase